MAHPNEDRLRDLYAAFARGDLSGFLGGCTADVTFTVPGNAPVAGVFTQSSFPDLIGRVMAISGGSFKEDVLDVFANDEHGVLLLHHAFVRDGQAQAYRTAHLCELRDGLISRWTEHPGSLREFEVAWGPS